MEEEGQINPRASPESGPGQVWGKRPSLRPSSSEGSVQAAPSQLSAQTHGSRLIFLSRFRKGHGGTELPASTWGAAGVPSVSDQTWLQPAGRQGPPSVPTPGASCSPAPQSSGCFDIIWGGSSVLALPWPEDRKPCGLGTFPEPSRLAEAGCPPIPRHLLSPRSFPAPRAPSLRPRFQNKR